MILRLNMLDSEEDRPAIKRIGAIHVPLIHAITARMHFSGRYFEASFPMRERGLMVAIADGRMRPAWFLHHRAFVGALREMYKEG